MKIAFGLLLACASFVTAFQPAPNGPSSMAVAVMMEADGVTRMSACKIASPVDTRADFLGKIVTVMASAAIVLTAAEPAVARGRATLQYAYDKYAPRIKAGGEFYSKDLRALVGKDDWSGIKAALAEPPKRSKEDKAKVDGGTAERAAQAGGFSDARVLVACDLYAATFSDNSISSKTKKMKEQVEIMRDVIENMQSIAKQALGEESGAGSGLFGFGPRKLSKDELSQKMRQLYVEGGNSYNKYIFAANEELPIQFDKLPYL